MRRFIFLLLVLVAGFSFMVSLSVVNGQSLFGQASGGRLVLDYRVPEGWCWVSALCKDSAAVDAVPSKIGMWTKKSRGSIKPYVILRDKENELFLYHWRGSVNDVAGTGEYVEEPPRSIKPCEEKVGIIETLGGKIGNGEIDLPVRLAGLYIANRNPIPQEHLEFDNITFDGKLVEGFNDNSNQWSAPPKAANNEYLRLKATLAGKSLN